MSSRDTKNGYGSTTKMIHWSILLLIVIQFIMGYTLTSLPTKDPAVPTLTWWHESTGFLILILAVVFVTWRSSNVTPSLDELPALQRIVARAVHGLLYLCLFLQPLLGITEVMLSGHPIAFYGLFQIPQILPTNHTLSGSFGELHDGLAVVILVLVGMHAGAALFHEFVERDTILRRMLPGSRLD